MSTTIRLTTVGLGPGDPELVTIKGMRAIEAADLIFAPRSRVDEDSRALRIARPWIDSTRQQVALVTLPMHRDPVHAAAAYRGVAEEIGARLTELAARQGTARGVYLLLGDPLLYGTFTSIQAELGARYPAVEVEFLPGVTSFAAVAARAGLPLSVGDDRVAIVPALDKTNADDLRELCARFETVILMKVGRALPRLITALEELDLIGGALYAEYIGMPEERVVPDVSTLRDYEAPYLSLLIVRRGKVTMPPAPSDQKE